MKKFRALPAVIFVLCVIHHLSAQNADERIGNMINTGDWFALEESYPHLKGAMESQTLQKFAEAMIGYHFNQPERGTEAIDWLLENAQHEIGFGNTSNLIIIKSRLSAESGSYRESENIINDFLEQIKAFTDVEQFPDHKELRDFYRQMNELNDMELILPGKDVTIPVTIDQTGRGYTLFVPVIIKGKEYKFIFDTGAATSFISKRFADETGVKVFRDSIDIMGIEKGTGQMGVIDKMEIGDILIKNTKVAIAFPNETTDTIEQVDAVLGMDFIKKIKEVQIYPGEKKMVFPANTTPLPPTGRNLMFYNDQPYLKAYTDNNERLILHFDTGNVKSDLYSSYYNKHKNKIDLLANKKEVRRGGFGGLRYIDAFTLPDLNLKIGNTNLSLKNVEVLTENANVIQSIEDGSLGADCFLLTDRMIMNFEGMFLVVER